MNTSIRRDAMAALCGVCTLGLLCLALIAGAAQPPETAAAGAAYRGYLQSVKAGDMDAVTAAMVPERAAQLKAQKGSKDFPMMWGLFTMTHPTDVKVTDARKDGARLVLTVEALQADKNIGTIVMERIGGKWLVGEESFKGTIGGS